jgi:hypothetical protein
MGCAVAVQARVMLLIPIWLSSSVGLVRVTVTVTTVVVAVAVPVAPMAARNACAAVAAAVGSSWMTPVDFAGVFWPHYSRVFWPQAGFVRAGFVGARRAWWSMYRGARFGSLGSFGPA